MISRTAQSLMLAIVMVLTASCTTNDDPGFEYLRLQVDGQSTLAITKNDVLIRGIVVFFHGLNQNEFSLTSDQPHKTVTEKLLNAGFAVVASSAGGNAFGDPATLRNYRELGSMAREHYRIENIYFLAESIGAIPAVNLLASDYTSVRGFAAISPALNFDSATPEWPALAAKSPGGPPEPVNPMNLPLDAMKGKSIRFYISPQDTLVRPADNALAFQQHYGPVANISTVNCSGGHGDPSCLKGDDLVKWFAQLDQRS